MLGVNLGHVGFLAEAEVRRRRGRHRRDRAPPLDARGAADARRPGLPRRRAGDAHVGAQRGQRREGRPRADARGGRRDRRPAAVALGLRRRGVRHPDRARRRTPSAPAAGGLARGRGAAAGADQRARAVRPAAGGVARLGAGGRGDRPAPTAPACCGATAGGRSTCRRARGSRYAAATGRSGWRGCTRRRSPTGWSRSSTCPCRAGAAGRAPPPGRGRAGRPMLEEIRIGQLGVIEASTLELGPGFTVVTGETGAGKTMVVTALGLLLGGRADSGVVRSGAGRRGSRASSTRPALPGSPRRSTRPAASSRTASWCWPATSPARAGRAPTSAARRCRVACWPSWPSSWWPCTASPTSTGCSSRRAQREALDRFAGDAGAGARWRPTPPCYDRLEATERELDEVVGQRPRAGPGGRPAAVRAGRDRGGRPRSRARTTSSRPRRPGSATPTRCAPPPSRRARRWPSEAGDPGRAGRAASAARTAARRRPRARPRGRRRWPTGWPRSPTCSPTWPPTWRPTPPRSRPTRPGWPRSRSGGRR